MTELDFRNPAVSIGGTDLSEHFRYLEGSRFPRKNTIGFFSRVIKTVEYEVDGSMKYVPTGVHGGPVMITTMPNEEVNEFLHDLVRRQERNQLDQEKLDLVIKWKDTKGMIVETDTCTHGWFNLQLTECGYYYLISYKNIKREFGPTL